MSALFFVGWALGLVWAWLVTLIKRKQRNKKQTDSKLEKLCTWLVNIWYQADYFLFKSILKVTRIILSVPILLPVLLLQAYRRLYGEISHRRFFDSTNRRT